MVAVGFSLTVLLVVGLFISTFLISMSELLLLLVWLVLLVAGGVRRGQFQASFSLSLAQVGLLLLFLMVVSVSFSSENHAFSWSKVGQYRELLLFPLLVFFLVKYPHGGRYIYYVFLVFMGLVIIHSWGQFIGLFPVSSAADQPYASVVGRIAGAIMLAFTCFAYLEEARKAFFSSRKLGSLWLMLFLFGAVALFVFFEGRTGVLIFAALACVWGWRYLKWKGMLLGVLTFSSLLVGAYIFSENIRERVAYSQQEIVQLGEVDFSVFGTSRAEYYSKTLHLLPEVLPLGGGSGSFATDMAKAHLPLDVNFENPHNEYLLILYEQGVLGFVLLVLFFALAWSFSNSASESVKWLVRALVVTMTVGCFFNSLLLDNVEAHFYVVLLAALIGIEHEEKKKQKA